jgi:hypothetical protein
MTMLALLLVMPSRIRWKIMRTAWAGPLLERCREHAGCRRAHGAAARAVLGEINDTQELAWRRSIAVVEDGAAQPRKLSLFPEDRCEGLLGDATIVGVRLSELRLRRPRQWGACWLALMLWHELQLDQFWSKRLGVSRKEPALAKAGARGGTGCCCCWRPTGCWPHGTSPWAEGPRSEWRLHREWFQRSAVADLLGEGAGLAEIHKLYRCHDRLLEHKQALFDHLVGRWRDLFNTNFDVLLYALSHQVKRCLQVLLSLFTSLAAYESGELNFLGREWTRLFGVAACRVCRLLPAPFDGMLDDRTIIGLA